MTPAFTAIGVAAFRALYTALGLIDDPCARCLVPAALRAAFQPDLARLLSAPVRIVSRNLSLTVPLRTVAIDRQIEHAVEAGAQQVVLLGSGLDARPWRLPILSSTAVFEIDRGRSHGFKMRRLANYPVLSRSHAFIDSDIAAQGLPKLLADAGFRADLRTVWVCEGVLIYVPGHVSARMLDTVAELSAEGSTLIATYTTPDLGGARFTGYLRAGAWLIGEPIRGGLHPEQMRSMLSARGFRISREDAVTEWNQPQTPGPQWERLVVAVRGT